MSEEDLNDLFDIDTIVKEKKEELAKKTEPKEKLPTTTQIETIIEKDVEGFRYTWIDPWK